MMQKLEVMSALVLLVALAARTMAAESCTSGFPDLSTLRKSAAVEGAGDCTSTVCGYYRTQVIIPAVNFTCHGNITGWLVGGEKMSQQEDVWPQVQLWRPATGVGDAYSLVQSVSLVVLQTAEPISTNVYESVMESPLGVQPGDVIGVVQDPRRRSSFTVYYQRNVGNLIYIIGDHTTQVTNFSISEMGNTSLTQTATGTALLTPVVSVLSSTSSINPLASTTQPSPPLPTGRVESPTVTRVKFVIVVGGIVGGAIAITALAVLATTTVCVVRRKRKRGRKVNFATAQQERSDDYVELNASPQDRGETVDDRGETVDDREAVDERRDSAAILIDSSHSQQERLAPIVMATNLAYHTHSREASLVDLSMSPQYCEINDAMFSVSTSESALDARNKKDDCVIREPVYENSEDLFPMQNDEGDYVIRELVYENQDDVLQRGASVLESEPVRGEHGYLKLLSSSELAQVPEYAEVHSEDSTDADMYASIDPESVTSEGGLLSWKQTSSTCELDHSYEQVQVCDNNSQ